MLINLSDVLAVDGRTLQKKVILDMDSFESKLGSFKLDNSKEAALLITNIGDRKLSIEVKCDLSVYIPCDRCLEDVKKNFHIDFNKEFDMNLTQDDRLSELDESDYISECDLDVDKLIYNEILVNWPMKVLCRQDCKGICNTCGANLNNGDCGCDRTVLDPRMAAIQDIFKNSKQ